MKKILAILLTLAMLLSLAACGGEDDPNAGKYIGVSAAVGGFAMAMSDVYPGETQIELKSNGKGNIVLGGDSFPMKWALEGDVFTLTIDGVDSVGKLSNGTIVIDLMDMGCVMTFEKEITEEEKATAQNDKDKKEKDTKKEDTKKEDKKDKDKNSEKSIAGALETLKTMTYQDAGYWELIRIDSENPDEAIAEEDFAMLKELQLVMYLELFEDGTGILATEEEEDLIWMDGAVCIDGETAVYTRENEEILMSEDGTTLVFRKCEKPLFLYSELEAAGFSEFMEVGVLYPFTTDANSANPVPTTGEVIVTSYEVFDSAEGYPAKEGYEWRIAEMEAMFFDDNARWYGIKLTSCREDYYNTRLHDDTITDADENGMSTHTVIYNRVERDVYSWSHSEWTGWQYNENGRKENKLHVKHEYLVPKGYDGVVMGYVNSKNEWADGSAYITDFDPADCILFRLK